MAQFFRVTNFSGGMNDSTQLDLDLNYAQQITNMRTERGVLVSRNGYSQRYEDATPWGSDPIQALFQWEDVNVTKNKHLLIIANGQMYRDNFFDANAPQNITGTVTLSEDGGARFSLEEYDGGIFGTDGINPPFVIVDGESDAIPVTDLSEEDDPPIPGRTSQIVNFKQIFFFGNFTDIDGTERSNAVIYSDIDDITLFAADQGARNLLDKRGQVLALQEHSEDTMLIMKSDGIWYVYLDPSTAVGQARTNFTYRQLSRRVGTKSPQSVVTTPIGTFFVDIDGIYFIEFGSPPPVPRYVSRPIETFWERVNKAALDRIVAIEIPDQNGVLICVPYGSTQTENNRAIFLNYELWSQTSGGTLHPAFSIYEGGGRDFSFNSLANIIDTDGNLRLIAGDYDGNVVEMNEGIEDLGDDYIPSLVFPPLGHPNIECRWTEVVVDIEQGRDVSFEIEQTNFGNLTPIFGFFKDQDIITGDAGPAIIGIARIGSSRISGNDLRGHIVADLYGESRYTKLEITLTEGLPFKLYGATVRYDRGTDW